MWNANKQRLKITLLLKYRMTGGAIMIPTRTYPRLAALFYI